MTTHAPLQSLARSHRAALAVAAAVAVCVAAGCGPRTVELAPLPTVDLEGAEGAVKDHLREHFDKVEELAASGEQSPELAAAYGELGSLLVAYGFGRSAVGCFSNAARLDEESFRWAYLHGLTLEKTGQVDEALSEFSRASDLQPDSLVCLIKIGRLALAVHDLERADEAFAAARALDSEAAAVFEGLGDCAIARGDDDAAVEFFRTALDFQPDATSLHHRLALSLERLGRTGPAATHREAAGEAPVLVADAVRLEVSDMSRSVMSYRERAAEAMARQRYAAAAALYLKALEVAPADVRTLWEHGLCLERLGDGNGAIRQLRAAIAATETSPEALSQRERSALHQSLATVFARAGLTTESMQQLETAIDTDSSNRAAHIQMAANLASEGLLADALEIYERVLGAEPADWELLVQRGSVLVDLGRTDRGLRDFRRAVELAPESPEARMHLADALEYSGRQGEAQAARREALALEESDLARARLLLREAQGRLQRGDIERALERCAQAADLAPDLADARLLYGQVLGHVGRLDEALDQFDAVLTLDGRNPPAWSGRTTILILSERWQEARAALEEAIGTLPNDRRFVHALARVLASAPDDGVRDGARAVELALRVLDLRADIAAGETLAMAHAEAGDTDRAADIQRRVLSEARPDWNRDRTGRAERQLQRYRTGEAWRAESPDEIIQGTLVGG